MPLLHNAAVFPHAPTTRTTIPIAITIFRNHPPPTVMTWSIWRSTLVISPKTNMACDRVSVAKPISRQFKLERTQAYAWRCSDSVCDGGIGTHGATKNRPGLNLSTICLVVCWHRGFRYRDVGAEMWTQNVFHHGSQTIHWYESDIHARCLVYGC